MEDILFICQCNNIEHQLVMSYFKDDDPEDAEVYCQVHLCRFGFFARLWYGIKYIFGYKSKYGAFEEFIFKPEDWIKLHNVTNFLQKKYELKNKRFNE